MDLLKVLPRFPYVRTGSNDSIYDTSIIEVADIPRRNSPYYVAYTRTWIPPIPWLVTGCDSPPPRRCEGCWEGNTHPQSAMEDRVLVKDAFGRVWTDRHHRHAFFAVFLA